MILVFLEVDCKFGFVGRLFREVTPTSAVLFLHPPKAVDATYASEKGFPREKL
jgi:hypothetical protein